MKKRFLAFICAILALSTVFSLVGCNTSDENLTEQSTEKVTEAPTAKPEVKPTEKPTEKPSGGNDVSFKNYNIATDWRYFKLIGRTQEVNGGVSCDFTASGIEFSGIMSGEVTLSLECDRATYFTVYVDGERSEYRLYADSSISCITLASFEGEDTHSIRVLKQTEPQWSLAVLKEISVKGKLDDAPARKDKYIEIIGDSITCGYGNLTVNGTQDAGQAVYEDGTLAYSFMTAEALNADYSIVGCSGIGIDKGWTDFSESDFYPKASFYRDRNGADYEFVRVPDLVIINLGTNDQSRGSTENDFKAGVRALINYIRDSYGSDVPVVWAYNMMGNGRFDWTKTVLEDMGGESNGLYYVQLEQNNEGGAGHPDLEAQRLASETLTRFIVDKKILTNEKIA